MNEVFLQGNAGKDGLVAYTKTGKSVLKFTLATSKQLRDNKVVVWHNIVAFGFLTERQIKKGDLIFIHGEISNEPYTDKDGVKKYFSSVIAREIEVCQKAPSHQDQKDPVKSEVPVMQTSFTEEDIPF